MLYVCGLSVPCHSCVFSPSLQAAGSLDIRMDVAGAELTVENRGAGDMGLRRVGNDSDNNVYLF